MCHHVYGALTRSALTIRRAFCARLSAADRKTGALTECTSYENEVTLAPHTFRIEARLYLKLKVVLMTFLDNGCPQALSSFCLLCTCLFFRQRTTTLLNPLPFQSVNCTHGLFFFSAVSAWLRDYPISTSFYHPVVTTPPADAWRFRTRRGIVELSGLPRNWMMSPQAALRTYERACVRGACVRVTSLAPLLVRLVCPLYVRIFVSEQ